jgi:hypothetical protein
MKKLILFFALSVQVIAAQTAPEKKPNGEQHES